MSGMVVPELNEGVPHGLINTVSGTEDMLATILWRCTAEALRHVGVDADYCRAMVAMLSKLMELCDMIGSR